MEKVKIVGKRSVSFVADDGKQISGSTLYITREDANVEGLVADKMFIGINRLSELTAPAKVGTEVLVEYNSRGKVADLHPVPASK